MIDAYPVEGFQGMVFSETSFSFSWSPPSIAAHLTNGYQLECVPLLVGIPTPATLMLGPAATSANMTGLYSGVTYDCSISTLSDEGSSQPKTLSLTTPDIGNYSYTKCYFLIPVPRVFPIFQSLLVLQGCLRQLQDRDK